MVELLTHVLLFWLITGLLGLPFVLRLPLDPVEKIAVAGGFSLIVLYLLAGGRYLARLDPRWFWLLPVLALATAIACRDELRRWRDDVDVRSVLRSYALLVAWSVGWTGLIVSYSGGGWAGDWFEHYDRVRFFLEHQPLDTRLAGLYALPARPPLANLVTGVFQAMARGGFASFQLGSVLLATLVFWPVCLFARRWGKLSADQAAAGAALALALNPLFLQNTAFSWTKLPTAFLILLGVYCYQEGLRRREARLRSLAALLLGAAAITHYSAAPYLIALGLVHLWLHRRQWRAAAFWRETVGLAAIWAALPATWFAWALAHYGVVTTLASNTTIIGNPLLHVTWWGKAAANLYNSFVPHPLATEAGLMAQSSPWGSWRDFFFNIYQVNLPWALGSVGCVIVVRGLASAWARGTPDIRRAVASALVVTIVTGIVVNGDLDPHGTTHLCLQAIVLGGVALLAANWPALPSGWQRALLLGWAFDFCAGIALQFANQGLLIDRWLHPAWSPAEVVATFSMAARMNFDAKLYLQAAFIGEHYRLPAGLLLAALGAVLVLLVRHAWRARAAPEQPLGMIGNATHTPMDGVSSIP